MTEPRRHVPIDRIGWALATGVGACALASVLVSMGSGAGPLATMVAMLAAAILGAGVLVLIGWPLWWLAGRYNWRGPAAAAAVGAGTAALVALVMLRPASGDPAGWTSALTMAAVAAFLGALTALAMWLVAYPAR